VQLFNIDDVIQDNSSLDGVRSLLQRELRVSITLLAFGLISNDIGEAEVSNNIVIFVVIDLQNTSFMFHFPPFLCNYFYDMEMHRAMPYSVCCE
jgi:hypothetical protein